MRWLIVLILVLLAAWYFTSDPGPIPIEETVIADQVKALEKAEDLEAGYLKATKEKQDQMEKQIEEDPGGS